jgi:hypothetical protein
MRRQNMPTEKSLSFSNRKKGFVRNFFCLFLTIFSETKYEQKGEKYSNVTETLKT